MVQAFKDYLQEQHQKIRSGIEISNAMVSMEENEGRGDIAENKPLLDLGRGAKYRYQAIGRSKDRGFTRLDNMNNGSKHPEGGNVVQPDRQVEEVTEGADNHGPRSFRWT